MKEPEIKFIKLELSEKDKQYIENANKAQERLIKLTFINPAELEKRITI